MDTEFLSLKNPGKKIRSWFTKKKNLAFDIKKAKFFVTFQSLTQVSVPNKGILENRISMWNRNGLNNRIRTFIFKFYNNLLGLNTRLSHFVIDQSRQCAFCTGTAVPVPDETFLHLFFTVLLHESGTTRFYQNILFYQQTLTELKDCSYSFLVFFLIQLKTIYSLLS